MRLQARNLTPALSVAGAICDHLHDWVIGTPEGTWVSMGVASDGSYGVPENLYFSFPVTCQNNQWHIVQVGQPSSFYWPPDCLPVCDTFLSARVRSAATSVWDGRALGWLCFHLVA